MERICEGAREFNGETIVEILADNPLVHSSLIGLSYSGLFRQ